MRVTNKMLSDNYLNDMNVNLQNMQTIQQQMATGKNFSKPSDDPFDVARSMQMNTAINANTQYNKNITNVINWTDTTDTALGQLGNVFQSIRGSLVSAGNAAYTSSDRQKIKDQINQQVGQISQILNTNFDGEYIFGGTKGTSKPVNTNILPSNIIKSNPNGGDITITGNYSGSSNSTAPYQIKITDNTLGKEAISVSNDGGSTWNGPLTATNGIFDIGNGLNLRLASSTQNSVGDIYNFNMDGNTKLVYSQSNGDQMQVGLVESAKVQDVSSWSNGQISLCINGSLQNITIGSLSSTSTLDDLIKGINSSIQANSSLAGKVVASKTSDGKVSFESISNDIVNIADTSISDIQNCIGKNFQSSQFDMIGSSRETEISQGVKVAYNVSASDILKYGDNATDDVRALLSRIVNHLDGKNDDGTTPSSTDTDPTTKLAGQDLSDLDNAITQLLKVRSQVGAKGNTMTSAQSQNQQTNLDMTDILSKTEDVDMTQKTMEYANMQTVYLASLQTSAKVIQPTLMDYLK